jgi:uncharacterized cupredoxin-like copper-binding protein
MDGPPREARPTEQAPARFITPTFHRFENLMTFQPALKFIAVCTLSTLATAAFPQHNQSNAAHPGATKKEQKPWGIAGDSKAVTRTVTISMTDNMRFTPDKLSFKEGETVRFVIRNDGKLLHELVIGTKPEFDAHAAMMAKHPGMAHEEPYMAHVAAGKSGGLVWTFNRTGEFDFACLVAGHYQAGMAGKITVAAP